MEHSSTTEVQGGAGLNDSTNGKPAEDDERTLHAIKLRWGKNIKSNLGLSFQLNLFQDNQDFDQFTQDDERPYSKESSFELIASNKLVVLEDKLLGITARLQSNSRRVNNVLNDEESLLSYKSTNLFLKSEMTMIDVYGINQLVLGGDLSSDLAIDMTENTSVAPSDFYRFGVYSNGLIKNKYGQARINARVDQMRNSTVYALQFGQDIYLNNTSLFSAQVGSSSRQASFYELYSIYGNKNLLPENNLSFELSYTKIINNLKLKWMSFLQRQNDLIYYDFASSGYLNQKKNIFSGVSFDIKYVSDNLSVGGNVSGTDSRDESLQLGVSPLKATLNLSYLFSNNLKMELQEIYYGHEVFWRSLGVCLSLE